MKHHTRLEVNRKGRLTDCRQFMEIEAVRFGDNTAILSKNYSIISRPVSLRYFLRNVDTYLVLYDTLWQLNNSLTDRFRWSAEWYQWGVQHSKPQTLSLLYPIAVNNF